MTLDELDRLINEYKRRGLHKDTEAACEYAQMETKEFIYRTHPHGGFSSADFIGVIFDHAQFIRGTHKFTSPGNFLANVYANYFARWYNTGAFGRPIRGTGPRRGQKGPTYPPHGNYFEANKTAIEDYYARKVDEYLTKHISI